MSNIVLQDVSIVVNALKNEVLFELQQRESLSTGKDKRVSGKGSLLFPTFACVVDSYLQHYRHIF